MYLLGNSGECRGTVTASLPCIWLTAAYVFWKVIEEIEEMMQESPDPEDDETPTQSDRLSMLSQEIQTLKRSSMSSYEESKRPSLPQSLGFLSMSNTSCQPLQKALIFLGPLALYILCRYSGLCCISFRLWTSLLGLWEEFTADGVASAAWIYFLAVLTASGPRLRVGCFSFLACGWPSFPWPSIYTYLCPHFIFL